ncbi:MAG: AAA family ATPase, partial [Pyrobaculum sp.]
ITVQLPDVIPEEELDEIVALYCPERVELARKIYRERPDLTVRELLIELNHMPARKYVELTPID